MDACVCLRGAAVSVRGNGNILVVTHFQMIVGLGLNLGVRHFVVMLMVKLGETQKRPYMCVFVFVCVCASKCVYMQSALRVYNYNGAYMYLCCICEGLTLLCFFF